MRRYWEDGVQMIDTVLGFRRGIASQAIGFESLEIGLESLAREIQSPAIGFQSLAIEYESPARGVQSLALKGKSLEISFESPARGLQSLEIEAKIRENGVKLPYFNTLIGESMNILCSCSIKTGGKAAKGEVIYGYRLVSQFKG